MSTKYLADESNVFHQLRGHFLRINEFLHSDFVEDVKEEKKDAPSKKHMQVNILESRMMKLQYQKMKKKGGQPGEKLPNLQTQTSGYYSMDFLWQKLKQNDEANTEDTFKRWNQLELGEKEEKIKQFLEKFKMQMEEETWKVMYIDVIAKVEQLDIVWHKQSQKVMEINHLVINPSCFYWDTE